MPITPFLKNQAFGPETIEAMGIAYRKACARLKLPETGRNGTAELVAAKIIDLAQYGERDPDELCRRVLADFNVAD